MKGGNRGLGERRPDLTNHPGWIVSDLLIGEPESSDAKLGEGLVSETVVAGLLLVPTTVELDHQGSTVTVKVRDITSDELLSVKMNPESAAPKFLPEALFFGHLMLAQFARMPDLFGVDRLAADDVARHRRRIPDRAPGVT